MAAGLADDRVGDFPLLVETPPPGLVGRYFGTQKHVLGLIGGGINAWVRSRNPPYPRGYGLARFAAFCARPFLDKDLLAQPFPVQLRKRLEILGPTYIKLGQVLSLREDILPAEITDELKNLLDRLPAVPLDRLKEIIEKDLKRPVVAMFSWIDPNPLGSASIGQVHKAKLLDGKVVIVKVVKPGNRELLKRDTILLNLLGRFLQTFLERLQPRKVFKEFSEYTLRELDLTREADNAETFAANFRDMPDVVFPKIFREFSGRDVLCMEFLDGYKPTAAATQELDQDQRDHLLDLGAASIIRMLYRDGFFHADLHPGNLMILPGPKVGFIDLGMVGRFTEELEEICRRWAKTSNFKEYPLAHLILRSVAQGARYDMYFPVETVLMVKALVTFEGVGQILNPGFDVKEVSQKHVNAIFLDQFSPFRLAKEGLRGAPELIEALSKAPMLITEGLRLLESAQHQPRENPFAGLKTPLLAGACIIGAAILISFGRPWYYFVPLLTLGLTLALWRRR